jgi:cell division protein FtsQ
MVKKQTILNWMLTTLWLAMGAGLVVLLVAAIRKEDSQPCTGINVVIKGVSNNFFVDKKDILKSIDEYIDGSPVGQPVHLLNLKALESDLQKNIWVKQAQLFFDNNAILQVIVVEREPVARVFTNSGTTFYIDSATAMLPLSEKYSARLPVFTNFPSDKAVLLKQDSLLLKDIYTISMAIQKDSFWMAMIDQIDITPQRNFELVPKVGNSIIVFGDAVNATEKLHKLLLFYKEVIIKTGWDKYSVINVQYANQVVAKRKGAEDKTSDSLRTLQLMHLMAFSAEQQANDSLQNFVQDNEHNTTDVNLIQQSIQRDDNGDMSNITETTNLQGIPVIVPSVLIKPLVVKKEAGTASNNHNLINKNKPAIIAVSKLAKPKQMAVKPFAVKAVNTKQVSSKPVAKKPVAKPSNDY